MVDGPNTYGFCGGDPVNRSDPMGTTWYAAEAGGYVWRQEGGDGPNPTQADWDRLADITGHEGAFVGSSYMVPNANGYLRSNGEFIYFGSEAEQVSYEGRVMGHNQALGDLREAQRVAAARAKAGERTTWTVYANGRAVRSGVSADGYSAALRSELEREEVWGDFHPGLRDYPGFNAIGRAVADQSNAAMSAYKEGMTEVAIAIATDKGLGLLFKGAKWGYSALTKVDDLARGGQAARRANNASSVVRQAGGTTRKYRFWDSGICRARHKGIVESLERGSDVAVEPGSLSFRKLGELTKATGREVSVVRRTDGTRVLRLGEIDEVGHFSAVRPGEKLIAHTHPNGMLKGSPDDIRELIPQGQRSGVTVTPSGAHHRYHQEGFNTYSWEGAP